MVMTRNQGVRLMCRGDDWTVEEEKQCYDLFFEACGDMDNLDDPAVFDGIWPDLARPLSAALNQHYPVWRVRSKIYRLRVHFKAFQKYSVSLGFQLVSGTSRVRVSPGYLSRLILESDIEMNFLLDGFPRYRECLQVFVEEKAAEIDFGPNPFGGVNGGTAEDSMIIEYGSHYEEDIYCDDTSEGYDTDNRDPFSPGWDAGLARPPRSPPTQSSNTQDANGGSAPRTPSAPSPHKPDT